MEGQDLDEALRAIAHPDRRLFIKACFAREQAAGELAALSALSLATVSEHLKVLRKSGLLVLNREGRFWLYRTDKHVLNDVVRALSELGGDDGT